MMIAKTSLVKNLSKLDRLYKSSVSAHDAQLFAKLAILEMCGWIEEAMDDIVHRCAMRKLKVPANVNYVKQSVIKRTYGFVYDEHFRRMLLQVVGLCAVEKIEATVDPGKFQTLQATLKTLKVSRDSEAHTHTSGITKVLDAPSVTIAHFQRVYDGLSDVCTALKTNGF